jgi:LCP family protein required for cell wall assembly
VVLGSVALIAACIVTSLTLNSLYVSFGQVPRVSVGQGVLDERAEAGDPINILLVGSTATDGIAANDDLNAGRGNIDLTDTLMVLRLDPVNQQVTVISLMRDLWVPINGSSESKINAALELGGVKGLVKTVQDYFKIPINDVMMVNFSGFRKIIDQVGGVYVWFPYPARDYGSFFDANAGCQKLNGEQALNYVRSRHYEQQINGRWTEDNKNDYGRVERQRDFLILMLDRVIAKGGRNPLTMRSLIESATDPKDPAVTLDEKLTPKQLLDLGRSFSNLDPEAVQRFQLPVYGDIGPGGASIVRMKVAEAQPILDIFRGGAPAMEPRDVSVKVVEGRSDSNDPVRPDRVLSGLGFKINGKVTSTLAPVPATVIRYSSEQKNSALLVGRYLVSPPVFEKVDGVGVLDLVVGRDYNGFRLVPADPADVQKAIDNPPTTTEAPTTTKVAGTTKPGTPATTAAPRPTVPEPTTTSVPAVVGRAPDGVSCP